MVYLICFDHSYLRVKHYVGFVDGDDKLERRLERHQQGRGSRLLAHINGTDIEYSIVRVWPGQSRKFERQLKNQHNHRRYCPRCRPDTFIKQVQFYPGNRQSIEFPFGQDTESSSNSASVNTDQH